MTREIAETLFLSPRTVDTHVQAIFEKLGVRARVELTALVIRPANLDARRGNARAVLASLVGRDDDVCAIAALVARHRVVTIVGTGGVGKTQVSLRARPSKRFGRSETRRSSRSSSTGWRVSPSWRERCSPPTPPSGKR